MTKVKYEEDYYLWTQIMVEKLKNKDYLNVDWDNLIEAIEDMGKSQKRAVESLLLRLTEHLLKLKYWRATPRYPKGLPSGRAKRYPLGRRETQGNARDEAEKSRNKKHWQSDHSYFTILRRDRDD